MKRLTSFPMLGWLLLFSPGITAQVAVADSSLLYQVAHQFQEAIHYKDSIAFNALFFHQKVPFIGIMSSKTEWSFKKDYADFEGIAVSDHEAFIKQICKSEKEQVEKLYDIKISHNGIIASISFDYAFYAGHNMIQWGHEKWNLVKLDESWLITDVVYSIHIPKIEAFPYTQD